MQIPWKRITLVWEFVIDVFEVPTICSGASDCELLSSKKLLSSIVDPQSCASYSVSEFLRFLEGRTFSHWKNTEQKALVSKQSGSAVTTHWKNWWPSDLFLWAHKSVDLEFCSNLSMHSIGQHQSTASRFLQKIDFLNKAQSWKDLTDSI